MKTSVDANEWSVLTLLQEICTWAWQWFWTCQMRYGFWKKICLKKRGEWGAGQKHIYSIYKYQFHIMCISVCVCVHNNEMVNTHTLSHMYPHSPTHTLSLSHTLSHAISLSLTHTPPLSHTHILSLSHTHTPSLTDAHHCHAPARAPPTSINSTTMHLQCTAMSPTQCCNVYSSTTCRTMKITSTRHANRMDLRDCMDRMIPWAHRKGGQKQPMKGALVL